MTEIETMIEYIDARQITVGNRLVIVGVANSIYEYYEQYMPSGLEDCRLSFGESPITRCFWEAYKQGARSVFCIPIKKLDQDNIRYALDTIDKYQYDVLLIADMYESHVQLMQLVDEYISYYSAVGNGLLFVTSTEPMFTSDTNDYISRFTTSGSYSLSNNRYIAVTAGDIIHNRYSKFEYSTTAAATFAGLIVSNKPYISPCNKTIRGVYLSTVFDDDQLSQLKSNGYIVFRDTVNKSVVATSEVTRDADDYFGISHTRVANFINQNIANGCKGFIGNAINLLLIDTKVNDILEQYKQAGYYRDYRYNITRSGRNEVTIDLQIRPNDIVKIMKTSLKILLRQV